MKKLKNNSSHKKITGLFLGFLFVSVGTYNSIVVNSDSFMDSEGSRFVKRLDEMNGVVVIGRKLAHQGNWVKVTDNALPVHINTQVTSIVHSNNSASTEAQPEFKPAISEDMNLNVVEIFNAKKFPQPLKSGEFSGSLSTKEGILENLDVKLPNGESIQISGAEMSGNVFEYDQDGSVYSGMIYEITKNSFMVTLTNGPFEGTRMKFDNASAVEESFGQEGSEQVGTNVEVAEYEPVVNDDGTQMEVGQFGTIVQPAPAPVLAQDAPVENSDVQYVDSNEVEAQTQQVPENESYGFNFEQQAEVI